MDALELLHQDHQTVKELLQEAKESDDPKKQRQLFRDIRTELETHARLEETIFYPAMAEHEELKEMVRESIEEHKQVKTLLRDMGRLPSSKSGSEKFKAKLKVLYDNMEHHAEEEEEGKMFPQIRKLVDNGQLKELGEEIENAKNKRTRKAS
jgi:hemerythrin superfamily protein